MAASIVGSRAFSLALLFNVLLVHCSSNHTTTQVCLPQGLGRLTLNTTQWIGHQHASHIQTLQQSNFTQLVYELWPHFVHLPKLFNCTSVSYNFSSRCYSCGNATEPQQHPSAPQYLLLHPVPLVMLILAALSLAV
uniref:ORF5 n=1 Tax=Simian hemorrhagic fever virus TaxID=38143 RepID=L0CRP3_SHFV|nr:ORF5 [Simian hemorrhagic fever virus]